ncbi:MAG: hypothetical protein M3347_07755 [Armatimonadota bacterium]|nr:hypothetical protein [Armatimonadota bacterium]
MDADHWTTNPRPLNFPNEIAQVGYGVADQTAMPIVKKGGDEVAAGTTVRETEKDAFLSTTARLTADARFQVLSDGRYVYLFRQAIGQADGTMVFIDANGKVSKNNRGTGAPVVNDTLLVDRFVLVGSELKPNQEVRYQRSRSKYRPQSNKDSLDAKDMEGKPFYEPTQELDFVRNLTAGRFTVLLLPTQVAEVERWQIFSHNNKTGLLDSFNVERAANGLFNTMGTQFYTCPNHLEVFEPRVGYCTWPKKDDPTQTCGQPLIPKVSSDGYGASALQFSGVNDYIDIDIDLLETEATHELWCKTTQPNGGLFSVVSGKHGTNNDRNIYLSEGNLKARLYNNEIIATTGLNLADDLWHHVAHVYGTFEDGSRARGSMWMVSRRPAGPKPNPISPGKRESISASPTMPPLNTSTAKLTKSAFGTERAR